MGVEQAGYLACTQGAVCLLLQQEEPSAKIAIAALHPDGPKAAAADARREKFNPRAAGLLADKS